MAFQVDFSAKNVPRFSFELLVAPKLKKQGGGHNAPQGHNIFTEPKSNRIKEFGYFGSIGNYKLSRF